MVIVIIIFIIILIIILIYILIIPIILIILIIINQSSNSRGVKRQNGNKSLPSKTYLPTGLTQNNHRFQCSLAQIKNRYPLSGLFREKIVKTLNGWISCLALTAPSMSNR